MLIVTAGTGWMQERGKDKQVMQPGDVVRCPPGVEHRHGATATTSVTHYAVQENVDGSAVTCGERATDVEGGSPPTTAVDDPDGRIMIGPMSRGHTSREHPS
ncbi:hypothetical protein BYZ73_05335 [Rhodovulum viride]|uniref:Cupin type-2 domain-containing protein n=1 Tax=Rhodovulum viride TaxID=1231134 RepID=A0ABX9DIJ4_9RHOB|nr:hypothetical protein BYZ73_05335 [Rhodovulum viride]